MFGHWSWHHFLTGYLDNSSKSFPPPMPGNSSMDKFAFSPGCAVVLETISSSPHSLVAIRPHFWSRHSKNTPIYKQGMIQGIYVSSINLVNTVAGYLSGSSFALGVFHFRIIISPRNLMFWFWISPCFLFFLLQCLLYSTVMNVWWWQKNKQNNNTKKKKNNERKISKITNKHKSFRKFNISLSIWL